LIEDAFDGLHHRDHFEFMGIPRDATDTQVKEAYFRLAKPFHPDTRLDPRLSDLKDKRDAVFIRLGQAYEVLRTKGSRGRYAASLATPAASESVPSAGEPPVSEAAHAAWLAHESLLTAEEHHREGRYWDAIQLFESTIPRLEGPEKLRARVGLARALMKNPNWAKRAEESLHALLQEHPQSVEALLVLAELYRSTQMRSRASPCRRASRSTATTGKPLPRCASSSPPTGLGSARPTPARSSRSSSATSPDRFRGTIGSSSMGTGLAIAILGLGAASAAARELVLRRRVRTGEDERRGLATTRERLLREQEMLRESEVRYRQLVEAAEDIIYKTDAQGHVVYANPAALQAFGMTEGEIIGQDIFELIRPDYREQARRFCGDQATRDPQYLVRFPFLTRQGRVWVGQRVQPRVGGRRAGFQAMARNITERKLVEEAIEREREQLRQIVTHAPVAMAMLDREGRHLAHSTPWLKYAGYEGLSMVASPSRRCRLSFPASTTRSSRACWRERWCRSRGRDHAERWLQFYMRWTAQPWRGPDGRSRASSWWPRTSTCWCGPGGRPQRRASSPSSWPT
jgi:PAS domain S-box-containing protein